VSDGVTEAFRAIEATKDFDAKQSQRKREGKPPLCRECRGTGVDPHDQLRRSCLHCKGTGEEPKEYTCSCCHQVVYRSKETEGIYIVDRYSPIDSRFKGMEFPFRTKEEAQEYADSLGKDMGNVPCGVVRFKPFVQHREGGE